MQRKGRRGRGPLGREERRGEGWAAATTVARRAAAGSEAAAGGGGAGDVRRLARKRRLAVTNQWSDGRRARTSTGRR